MGRVEKSSLKKKTGLRLVSSRVVEPEAEGFGIDLMELVVEQPRYNRGFRVMLTGTLRGLNVHVTQRYKLSESEDPDSD